MTDKKKYFHAFAFLGKRGGVTIKKRYKIVNKKDHDDFKISFNGDKPIHIKTFNGLWVLCELHLKEITKAEAKKFILEDSEFD